MFRQLEALRFKWAGGVFHRYSPKSDGLERVPGPSVVLYFENNDLVDVEVSRFPYPMITPEEYANMDHSTVPEPKGSVEQWAEFCDVVDQVTNLVERAKAVGLSGLREP